MSEIGGGEGKEREWEEQRKRKADNLFVYNWSISEPFHF